MFISWPQGLTADSIQRDVTLLHQTKQEYAYTETHMNSGKRK